MYELYMMNKKNTYKLILFLILIISIFFTAAFIPYNNQEGFYSNTSVPPSPTPIENVGLGPFDYGLDNNRTISPQTLNSAQYIAGQGKQVEKGDFKRNMFSYFI